MLGSKTFGSWGLMNTLLPCGSLLSPPFDVKYIHGLFAVPLVHCQWLTPSSTHLPFASLCQGTWRRRVAYSSHCQRRSCLGLYFISSLVATLLAIMVPLLFLSVCAPFELVHTEAPLDWFS